MVVLGWEVVLPSHSVQLTKYLTDKQNMNTKTKSEGKRWNTKVKAKGKKVPRNEFWDNKYIRARQQ
jgi:hypothetical protein